jgi:hypothetical protein
MAKGSRGAHHRPAAFPSAMLALFAATKLQEYYQVRIGAYSKRVAVGWRLIESNFSKTFGRRAGVSWRLVRLMFRERWNERESLYPWTLNMTFGIGCLPWQILCPERCPVGSRATSTLLT